MQFRYSASGNAAYLRFADEGVRIVKTRGADESEISGSINFDFDENGCLVGIEFLKAAETLPKSFLDKGKV
jgi:uncharacterized protein YuzE